jgi:Flp pilus assembly protein TadB
MKRMRQTLVAFAATTLTLLPFAADTAAQAPGESVEVIIAIDTSESMEPAIEAAKAAANEFVVSMPAGVSIGVETFANDVTVLTAPTLDRGLITAKIGAIVTGGDTALFDVVVAASQHFTPTVDNKVLVLLSDGKDEGSVATLADAVAAVDGVRVEAISLTTSLTDLDALSALGTVTAADDAAAVSAAFARVADLLVDVVEPTTTSTSTPPTTVRATTVPATTVAAAVPATSSPPVAIEPAPPVETSSASPVRLWLGAGALFIGLFVLALTLLPTNRVSKARLGVARIRSTTDIGVRTTTAIEEALERYGKRDELGTALAVADISMKPAEFVGAVGVVAVVAGLGALLISGPIVGILTTILVCFGARVYVQRLKGKRQAAFAEQLPDVLQLVTTSLRSGYGVTQAFESVAEEAEEPARSEFAHVLVQARLGRDLSEAMRSLARRMKSRDLEWVVSAIDINRETGGNLSEILHQVGITIRDRARMALHVRTLTAEGRLSARILTGLPFVMLLWQWRINPESFALLTEGIGLIFLAFAGILILVGGLWVNKIVNSVAL